jgi:hypothetical protein
MCTKMSRQRISPEVTVKGFKKCCMSSVVDGTDDGMLRNGSEGVGNVRSECEGDEGTDCEDGDSDTDWYRQVESDTLCVLSV